MKKNSRKLELKSNTIRVLSGAAMGGVAGGATRSIISRDSCSISNGFDDQTNPLGRYTCSCVMNCGEL